MQISQIDQKYTSALKAINYTVEQALRDFLILHLSERISAFKSECEAFERQEEDFAEEDDYMAWKFAEESTKFLQKSLEEIL